MLFVIMINFKLNIYKFYVVGTEWILFFIVFIMKKDNNKYFLFFYSKCLDCNPWESLQHLGIYELSSWR